MTRRVLIFAFFFPPLGGVSVPRTLGHVRHLPGHGWCPVVITPGRSSYHLQDPAGLAAVPPDTSVLRTPIIEPHGIKLALGRLARLSRRPAPHDGGRSEGRAATPSADARTSRWRRLLFFPDDQIGWLPFAFLGGWRAHRRHRATAILSSSSPITSHLAAGLLATATGLPWVAEFRDPWVGNVLAHPAPWMQRTLARRIERWIIGRADRVVFVTPGLTELYRRRYPARASRFLTVTNGYDLAEVPQRAPRQGSSSMRLVYAGTLDRPAELRLFLAGLELHHHQRREAGRDDAVRLEVIGHASDECLAELDATRARLGPDAVDYRGFLPRHEALARLDAADAALVLLGPGPGMGLFVGGKLYEYIGRDRQLLAMLPPGDARDVLASLGWGVVVDPEPSAVAAGLARLLDDPAVRETADPERRYERSRIVSTLADALDAAVAARGAP